MKILVPIKRVPNPEQKLKFAADKLDLSGAQWQVNPFDEYAVETALRLTEKGKGGEHVGRGGAGQHRPQGRQHRSCAACWPWAPTGRC